MSKAQPLTVYLPDTRGVTISPFGIGNAKLGFGVYTYSRLAGGEATCPGATAECESICYAKRIKGPVLDLYLRNGASDVPEIPAETQVLRIHVSGDFDTITYIKAWTRRLRDRPDVTCWAYTRSWRVPSLLPALEELRALPNMQLFASMDPSTADVPPEGWRRAWIYRDTKGNWPIETRLALPECKRCGGYGEYEGEYGPQSCMPCVVGVRSDSMHNLTTFDGGRAYVCPEETGRKQDCLSCGYCFEGKKHDVVFLEH